MIEVREAEYIENYKIQAVFNGGRTGEIDFKSDPDLSEQFKTWGYIDRREADVDFGDLNICYEGTAASESTNSIHEK